MTRQKSDRCVVPEGTRKRAPTRREPEAGGKAATVKQETKQLALWSGTAEDRGGRTPRADGVVATHLREAAAHAVPKPRRKNQRATSVTMEEVTERLVSAFEKVASNRGAAGPDGQSTEELREQFDDVMAALTHQLLQGNYEPGAIRRVWIPKAGGAERGLGIPNVVDRVVQEAVREVLEPQYEPKFHKSSHGFRPGRSCQTAIAEAKQQLEEGHEWVVDLDLEKFFDRVNHQRLMARLGERVGDRRVLALIGKMLRAEVVMPDGVVVSTEEGVPQGGPLSPLLSNIVLDELDQELDERGHRFVRYADDCNIYVRSERAGRRVMASVVRFIERRLRLKVNAAKSAVARPEERHFLGFRLRREPMDGEVEVLLSKRSKERIDSRIVELTPRNWGGSLHACITRLNEYVVGWIGFFKDCTAGAERTLANLDAHIRRRLRAIQMKHWKRKRTIARKLTKLGVKPKQAWQRVYAGRQSIWALSQNVAVHRGLRNAYFAERGLVSIVTWWRRYTRTIAAPAQLTLALG